MQGATAKKAPESEVYRLRLLEGFAESVSAHGYASVTVAQIVKNARVSKRTFYEHFADKEECFLALYTEASKILSGAVEAALSAPAKSWQAQLDAGLDAYLTALEANPSLTRACLLEINAAGPRALTVRLAGHAKFASLLREFVARTRKHHPEVRPLGHSMAVAIVAGLDELLIVSVASGGKPSLKELRATATELMRAVLGVPTEPDRRCRS